MLSLFSEESTFGAAEQDVPEEFWSVRGNPEPTRSAQQAETPAEHLPSRACVIRKNRFSPSSELPRIEIE